MLLVVAKYREAKRPLAEFLDAAAKFPDVRVSIKTHPAETPDVYNEIAAGKANVVVLPAAAPLAPLLRAARAIVTVNSTVALDAAVLGVPALVIGLPNNLSPFVDAGAMAGATSAQMEGVLRQILYDEKFRQQLERARGLLLARFRILSDGGAAERSAEAVLKLVE
jgi:UDP-N-acetylglucosamine 2-epimerase